MINFIYSTFASAANRTVLERIAKDCKNGVHSFLIVPDQEALQFERQTLSALPPSAQLDLEVLSFSRLYNRLCRVYGGLSYSYVTKPMRSLLMWKTLRELSPLLEEYGKSASDPAMTDSMINVINEFKANGVSAAAIEMAAAKLPKESALRRRLRDIALIYSCFDNFISEKYTDSADDLAKLRDLLKEKDFFKDSNVYIASFSSFTAVQHQIIELIFGSASNVTLTVPLSSPEHDDISTLGIRRSLDKLKRSAQKHGGHTDTEVSPENGEYDPAIVHLSQSLWHMDATPMPASAMEGVIVRELCDNPYAEAEAVAVHIRELLKKGVRCKDIVIIARDCERYRGILDTALKKSEIPFYMSQKNDVCSLPAVKFLLSALKIKKYGWQKSDVLSHLKTGLCDVSPTDVSYFEEYVNTWNIHGEGFLADCWTMNPDGFTARVSPRGERILAAANRVRAAVTEPLLKLFITLDAAENVGEMCKAIYTYINSVGLEDKLKSLAKKAADRKDLKQARELSDLYGIILGALADVGTVLGDEEADTEEFAQILKSLFDKTEIGTIPTSIDEVTVGSASTFRAAKPKYAFVIGLCEGEFPASIKDSGLLSTPDRNELQRLEIELADNNEVRSSDELMYVSRAFGAPTDGLFLLSHKNELDGSTRFTSLAFNRAGKLFKDAGKPHEFKMSDLSYAIPAPKNAVGLLRSVEDPTLRASLLEALAQSIPTVRETSGDVSEEKCRISPQIMEMSVGDSLRLSASSFDSYVSCPFSYFCSNVLDIREERDSTFNANDIGSFVHYVLEQLIKHAIPDDPALPPLSDEEIAERTDKAVVEYVERICPPSLIDSKRLAHLYDRLKSLSVMLIKNTVKEFSASSFRPVFYELHTNGKDGNPSPLTFTLDDGFDLSFSGYVDRVDLYKKDGKVYIRVVDYKTGVKDFSVEDVKHGVNLQMLLYLYTLCRNNSDRFMSAIGVSEGDHPLPAGVVYLSARVPTIEADDYDSSESILKQAEDKLKRSGLVLNDENILLAMNESLDTRFLAGLKKDKNGELSGRSLINSDGFDSLFEELSDTVKRIAAELHSGNADVAPLCYKDSDPCRYCNAKPICRRVK